MRKAVAAFALTLAIACVPALGALRANAAANDASAGYESIRPSLVKVWAFDRSGRPEQSGTGIVVDTNDRRSLVLTASHVVAGAAGIRIDVSREMHDLVAHVERTGPRDLTLLAIDRGGLHAARFAPRSHPVVEGNLVAVAGYVKNDELIGVVGQAPRILFPGTVSSRPDNGLYLELENVHIEEGLSGGAVFDPATGDVLGIVTSRTTDRRGGFADSGALVVLPFLAANNVASALPAAARVAPSAPRARRGDQNVLPGDAVPVVVAQRAPTQRAPAQPALVAYPTFPQLRARTVALALPAPARSLPAETLQAAYALPLPRPATGIASWQFTTADPTRFNVVRGGCRIAVTIDVRTLQFVIANQALVAPHRRGQLLAIGLQQRAGQTYACTNVTDEEATNGPYEPTAMAFDGKHVTMRFVYAGNPAYGKRFPADASLDADLDGESATATLQFYDRDWNGSIALPIARTPLTAVSSSW